MLYGAYALGPVIGYLMASVFLSIWINLGESAPVPELDPRWVKKMLIYLELLICVNFGSIYFYRLVYGTLDFLSLQV